MIKIRKGPTPQLLIDKESQWTLELKQARDNGADDERFRRRYRKPEIIDALVSETHGKCVYCECAPLPGIYRIVEHIVPWSADHSLAFSWSNLVLICERCNNAKDDYYDISDPVINPTIDTPTEELVFVSAMIFGSSTKGSTSVVELKLNRPDLYEARRKLLRQIDKIVNGLSAINTAPRDIRSIVMDAFASAESQYSQTAASYITRSTAPAVI
ncbi:MAG: HNH endonuclease [Candidatus Obscuribacterales bacterium]|jgi:hypothetical protein